MLKNKKLLKVFVATSLSCSMAFGLVACKNDNVDNVGDTDSNSQVSASQSEKVYGDWVTVKEPECNAKGLKQKVNINDPSDIVSEEIPALDHAWGEWEILSQPSFDAEGAKSRVCDRCKTIENQPIEPLIAKYTITIYDGDDILESVYVTEDGDYEITVPQKVGYEFAGFETAVGESFSEKGNIQDSINIYCKWQVLETKTFQELYDRALYGAKDIYITNDILLTDTIYVTGETTIYVDKNCQLTRSSEHSGELFVIGENENGESLLSFGKIASLALKPNDGYTLTVDGNKQNIEKVVDGSAFFIVNSASLNIYDGVKITNMKKLSNNKVVNDKYAISGASKMGGAAVAVVNGTFNMFGGEISDCEVSNNDARDNVQDAIEFYDESSCGGAIFNFGTVNIYGGNISGNKASRGGAIYNYRLAKIYGGNITQNQAKIYGGAIYLPASQYSALYFGDMNKTDESAKEITINVSHNIAGGSGGAIFGQTINSITIYSSTCFDSNKAESSNGGAINTSGALSIKYAEFKNNESASKGGAIYAYCASDTLTTRKVEIDCGLFDSNTSGRGGAIALSASSPDFKNGAKLYLGDVRFENNSAFATKSGDTASNDESVDSDDETLANGNGGAIYLSRRSELEMDKATFTLNSAEGKGGAVYLTVGSTLKIISGDFEQNWADGNGGAIYLRDQAFIDAQNANFISNTSKSNEYGGGALYFTGATGNITNCEFVSNTATAKNGGAVSVYSDSSVVISNSKFSKNSASGNGGALYSSKSTITSSGTNFSENSATGGGAVYIVTNSTFTSNGDNFSENSASGNGGALYVYTDASATLTDSVFDKNTAKTYGGASYMSGASVTNIYNVTATNNSAESGGFLYITTTNTQVNIYSGQATANTASNSTKGDTIWTNTAKVTLKISNNFECEEGTILGKATVGVIE